MSKQKFILQDKNKQALKLTSPSLVCIIKFESNE